MNKTTIVHAWNFLSAGMMSFILAGCGVIAIAITPIPKSPTAVPPYIHYTPSKESNIQLEFDYPSTWIISEDKIRDTDIMIITLMDPRFRSLPTRSPNESHGIPSNFGSVNIMVVPVISGQTLAMLVEPYKQGHSDKSWITELNEYKIIIDGYNANVLEYQINLKELYTSLMFERALFFIYNNQLYQITFTVSEGERDGEFEQGYEHFFNSIKIMPEQKK
jgi:hypothetical protein